MQETKLASKLPKSILARLPWRKIGIAFVVWTVLGLSFALRSYIWALQNQVTFPLWGYVTQTLNDFYLYALLSPLVLRLGRRFPLDKGKLIVNIPIHLTGSLIFTLIMAVLPVFTIDWLGINVCTDCPPRLNLLKHHLTSAPLFHQGVLVYWGIILVGQGLRYYRDMQSERELAARLSAQLSEAQLNALKMQIHPHFLFNTLNSIAALVQEDKDSAELMITKLSNFLRLTLKSSGAEMVTLKEELFFLKTYLEIEQVRFQERLRFEIECDLQAEQVYLPHFILQPLVENSIRHGLSRKKSGGFIKISGQSDEKYLTVEIEDNGAGFSSSENFLKGTGLGLRNTVERLKQVYEDEYVFEIKANQIGGTTVVIKIPALQSKLSRRKHGDYGEHNEKN